MAGTTTNYGWTYPTSTDLVKDGATAIQTAVQGADTTLFTALGFNYPGLRLIKKQTIGSAVSSVAVTSAFSATYENYKIVVSGGTHSTGGIITLALGASVTGYYNTLVYGNTWATPTATGAATNNGAAWNYAGFGDANQQMLNCDISSPFLSKYTFISGNYVSDSNAGAVQGVHKVATSYTGFTLTPAAGTMTGGTIYVYGYGAS